MSGLFALAGVVVGGILTGFIQIVLQRRAERRSVRTACRLLAYEVAIAGGAITGAQNDPGFDRDLREQLKNSDLKVVWSEHREVLAADLEFGDWMSISVAVIGVWLYLESDSSPIEAQEDESEAEGEEGDAEFVHPSRDKALEDVVPQLAHALAVLRDHAQ